MGWGYIPPIDRSIDRSNHPSIQNTQPTPTHTNHRPQAHAFFAPSIAGSRALFGGETRRHSSRPPMRGGPRGPGGRGEVDPDKPPMNDQLLRLVPNEVRVVISNPESGDDMAGVMPTKAALEKAREMGTCASGLLD